MVLVLVWQVQYGARQHSCPGNYLLTKLSVLQKKDEANYGQNATYFNHSEATLTHQS